MVRDETTVETWRQPIYDFLTSQRKERDIYFSANQIELVVSLRSAARGFGGTTKQTVEAALDQLKEEGFVETVEIAGTHKRNRYGSRTVFRALKTQ